MIPGDPSYAFSRGLEFTFVLQGKGVLGTGFGAGAFFFVKSRVLVKGGRTGPLSVELTCNVSKDSKEVAYQVADIMRKVALDWSALKKASDTGSKD
jgi:hypothetical protein